MKDKYSVHSDFDIRKHKKHFTDYLEVIIHPDGSIHYAVPSHQEYMIRFICKRDGITRAQLEARCPREYYFDFMTWLCKESGCVSVWSDMIQAVSFTRAQVKALDQLREANVLHLDMAEGFAC
ncbi:hypothetical protein [Faecalibaculum rodentium]|uniref:hypothetical protein n=1 Tax=Faecalibaculum rodentium TaxID=1702221 RepID=UPI00249146B5|nr:hypothetical protein [Faecalibaculum rodentium]